MKNLIILYQDSCGVCRKYIDFVSINTKSGKNIEFIDISNNEALSLSNNFFLNINFKNPESMIVISDRKIYTKWQAITEIGKNMKSPWLQIAYLSNLVPKRIGDILYDFLSKNRFKISKYLK